MFLAQKKKLSGSLHSLCCGVFSPCIKYQFGFVLSEEINSVISSFSTSPCCAALLRPCCICVSYLLPFSICWLSIKDVVFALAHGNTYLTSHNAVVYHFLIFFATLHTATGKTGRFTLIEKWRNNERLLAPNESPLKVIYIFLIRCGAQVRRCMLDPQPA